MEGMKNKIFELEMDKLKLQIDKLNSVHAVKLAFEKEKYEIMKKQLDEEIFNLLVTRDDVAQSVASEMYRQIKETENGETSSY